MDQQRVVSDLDNQYYERIRANVAGLIARAAERWDAPGRRVLDIAPQVHGGAAAAFAHATIETLDLDPDAGATYCADICQDNSQTIPSGRFDVVVCTEVLEHTLNPFAAVAELRRMVAEDGVVVASTPFNFRIHGPLPDCWRFTEHGLRELFRGFGSVEIAALEEEDRFLMPIHYTVVARP